MMKTNKLNGIKINPPRAQRGVVLLITLIILVAMTLAGIGMMRSVDTGNIIAGNMAFRQATLNASEAGVATGFTALMSVANSGNKFDRTILDYSNGQPCPAMATPTLCPGGVILLPGYSPTPLLACEVTQSCPQAANASRWWTVAGNWAGAPSYQVMDPNRGEIATSFYLIHRMCTSGGSGGLCQRYTQKGVGGTRTGNTAPADAVGTFYRITTRTVGTRNTVAFTQTLVIL